MTLDNVTLDTWTTCLTDNFIPNFQKPLKPGSQEDFIGGKPKIDLSAYENLIMLSFLSILFFFVSRIDYAAPAIYQGTFVVPYGNFDTFLKMDKFTKVYFLKKEMDM